MAFLILKSNPGSSGFIVIQDLGYLVPTGGQQVTLDEDDDIYRAQASVNLQEFLVDDAFGVGSSTIILNDGSSDIPQAQALNFLATVLLPQGDEEFGVVKTNVAGQVEDDLAFDGTATVSNLTLGNDADAGGNRILNLPSSPSAPGDAVSAEYVDGLFVQSRAWKELLLTSDQFLDGASGAVRQATVFYLENQPTGGDVLSITDGTTTRQYGFSSGGDVVVTLGANVDDTMTNLAAAISGDGSGLWGAVKLEDLESINAGAGASTAGHVVVIYRAAQASDSLPDRMFGSFAVPADAKYVNFEAVGDYAPSTAIQLPSSDPSVKQFGIGRSFGSLLESETHLVRSGDTTHTWDGDDQQWQLTGAAGVNYGLVGDIQSLGSSAAAGTSDRIARADHVHVHGDRGGDGSASQHDADQIDIEGTYTVVSPGGATDSETGFCGSLESCAGEWDSIPQSGGWGHIFVCPVQVQESGDNPSRATRRRPNRCVSGVQVVNSKRFDLPRVDSGSE